MLHDSVAILTPCSLHHPTNILPTHSLTDQIVASEYEHPDLLSMVSPPSLLRKLCFSKELAAREAVPIHQKNSQPKQTKNPNNRKKNPTTILFRFQLAGELKIRQIRNTELPVWLVLQLKTKIYYRCSHHWARFSSKFQGSHERTDQFFPHHRGGKGPKSRLNHT